MSLQDHAAHFRARIFGARHPRCRAGRRRCAAAGSASDAPRADPRLDLVAARRERRSALAEAFARRRSRQHAACGKITSSSARVNRVPAPRCSRSVRRCRCLDVRASMEDARRQGLIGARKTQQHGSGRSRRPKNAAAFELRASTEDAHRRRSLAGPGARKSQQQADSGRSTSSRTSRHSRSVPR